MSHVEKMAIAIAAAYRDEWEKLSPGMQQHYKKMAVRAAKSLHDSTDKSDEITLRSFAECVITEDHLVNG